MQSLTLSLPLSQIIAPDAPLSSPVSLSDYSDEQDMLPTICPSGPDAFNYSYYSLPPSPPHSTSSGHADSPGSTAHMLKMRLSPDSASDGEQLCLPTHQLFDFSPVTYPPTPPTPSAPSPPQQQSPQSFHQIHPQHRPNMSRIVTALQQSPSPSTLTKRSASPVSSCEGVTIKKRAIGERISSKDFVPPDVTGLSKREARLVKNRAAAFLSRQRKREEFELMEVRVAELEQENAKLLVLAQSGNSASPTPEKELVSEIEHLRAQLAAVQERERELCAELASKSLSPPVKVETQEPSILSSSPRLNSLPALHKSGSSLGLLVLLCALPTLFSMPPNASGTTNFSIPSVTSTSSAPFDLGSYLPNDYEWTRSNGNVIGHPGHNRNAPVTRKLEFVDSDALAALGGLDISFDASPSDDGKIRVRIHPTSSASSRATPPGRSSNNKAEVSTSSLAMWDATFNNSQAPSFSASNAAEDPFLGIGSNIDYSMPFSQSSMLYSQMNDISANAGLSDANFDYPSEFSIGDDATGGKRRVRIALKSMPVAGSEGGEWEVQIC